MKTLKLFFATILFMAFSANAFPQTHDHSQMSNSKTESFKVWGNCGMCKDRIENAVKSEGATTAVWDQKTMILTVSFDPKKTSLDALGKKLASVGHDTEKYKAPDDAYAKLPGCCKYERSK